MAFNDSLSDMLARIKNAHRARKSITSCYKSILNMNVLSVLKDEGYIRDFRDFEEQQIQDSTTDTSLIEGAREDAAIQSRVAQGIQQRNLERYGSELTPAERAEMARANQRGGALNLSNAVNNAQIQQEEANTRKLADLINVGQGVNRSSLGQLQSAAQDANSRKHAYKSAKAQTKAQNAGMVGSLASAAILAFAI